MKAAERIAALEAEVASLRAELEALRVLDLSEEGVARLGELVPSDLVDACSDAQSDSLLFAALGLSLLDRYDDLWPRLRHSIDADRYTNGDDAVVALANYTGLQCAMEVVLGVAAIITGRTGDTGTESDIEEAKRSAAIFRDTHGDVVAWCNKVLGAL